MPSRYRRRVVRDRAASSCPRTRGARHTPMAARRPVRLGLCRMLGTGLLAWSAVCRRARGARPRWRATAARARWRSSAGARPPPPRCPGTPSCGTPVPDPLHGAARRRVRGAGRLRHRASDAAAPRPAVAAVVLVVGADDAAGAPARPRRRRWSSRRSGTPEQRRTPRASRTCLGGTTTAGSDHGEHGSLAPLHAGALGDGLRTSATSCTRATARSGASRCSILAGWSGGSRSKSAPKAAMCSTAKRAATPVSSGVRAGRGRRRRGPIPGAALTRRVRQRPTPQLPTPKRLGSSRRSATFGHPPNDHPDASAALIRAGGPGRREPPVVWELEVAELALTPLSVRTGNEA